MVTGELTSGSRRDETSQASQPRDDGEFRFRPGTNTQPPPLLIGEKPSPAITIKSTVTLTPAPPDSK